MPVYVKEKPKYLLLALNSILIKQTVKPTELVIVEDGPLTPELNNLLDQYVKEFPQIVKLFKLEENMGMGYAMNFGLNKCSNEWVFRMDSDDVAVPVRFERQLEIIRSGKYDVIGAATKEFNELIGDINQYRIMPESHTEIIKFMKFRNPINHMTVAFKKSKAIEAGGYWDKRYFEDYSLWYAMFKIGAKFYNIQEVLVNARIGNNMFDRRSGYKYFIYEAELVEIFFKDKFLNYYQYKSILLIKLMVRLLPTRILSLIYQKLLRNRN